MNKMLRIEKKTMSGAGGGVGGVAMRRSTIRTRATASSAPVITTGTIETRKLGQTGERRGARSEGGGGSEEALDVFSRTATLRTP